MGSSVRLLLTVISLLALVFLMPTWVSAGGKSVLRGWLSDEGCAGGRAKSGLYTGTNPDCAKKCVSEGKQIVFVDPDRKRLLSVANQEVAKESVGDYVEISGEVNEERKTLRVDSLKLLEKGRAMCDVPAKKKF
jgi:hypothetical protein